MTCSVCGSSLQLGARFCARCGTPVSQVSAFPNARGAQFEGEPPVPPGIYVKGDRFVVPRGAVLPGQCVKCSAIPAEPWLRSTFSWHNSLLYVLLISPLIYIIVALIVRKQVTLFVPLCEEHRAARKMKLAIGAALLIACLPVSIALGILVKGDSVVVVAIFLGFALFLAGVISLILAVPLRATFIGRDSAEFAGASPLFLAEVARQTGQPFYMA